MKRMFRLVGESWDVLLFFGILFGLCAGGVWWGLYEIHFKEKWANEASIAKFHAEEEARAEAKKQQILAEARAFITDHRSVEELGQATKEMLDEAVCRVHPSRRRSDRSRGEVYPELYEIVPGLVEPGLSFANEATPSPEEFQRRLAAFLAKHQEIYGKQRERFEITFDEYLRIDRRELWWLDIMGNRLNDSVCAQAKSTAMQVSMVKDAVLAARFVFAYGSGQHCYAANSAIDIYEEHAGFSDALLAVLVAGGHDYFVPDGKYGNGILMPPEKPKDGVHQWSAVYNPRIMKHSLSFQACSVEPTVLTDLTGRIIAIQVGKEALRVTFYDQKGSPEKLTPAIIRLAELLGVKPQKKDAHWMRMDETTTWELKIGS